MGSQIYSKKSQLNKDEWIQRFTKKELKKKLYEDPNTTFKPELNKKTAKILKGGARTNAFESLNLDSKNR
jgi:hypothetical protein